MGSVSRFQNNFIRWFNGWCVCVCVSVCKFWYSDMVHIFLFLCEMCKQFLHCCLVCFFFYIFAYWRHLLCKLTIPVDVNDISFDSQHFKLFDFIICAVTYWFRVYTKKLLYFLANKCKIVVAQRLKLHCCHFRLLAKDCFVFCRLLTESEVHFWKHFRTLFKWMQIFTFLCSSIGAKFAIYSI